MAFKNIIFDIDGTILDSYDIYMNAQKSAIEKVLNYKLTKKEQEELFHLTNLDIQKKVGCTDEEFKQIRILAKQIILNSDVPLFDEIVNVIKRLKSNDYFIAINTSRTMREITREKSLNEIIKYFNFIVTCDKVKKPKPNSESFLLILDKYRLNKNETIMIGDSISDSISSHSAGIKFALASWGARDKSVACDFYLEKPSNIYDIIKRA